MVLDLEPGDQAVIIDRSHPNVGPAAERSASLSGDGTSFLEEPSRIEALEWLEPPPSIRVGYAANGGLCCTGSCTQTQVFSLEQYVRRGLNDEWISSWGADALRAGAVAYRSYGAWHALHPASGAFDLCSSACCQVNDSDTAPATDAAAAATSGLMLERDGALFRAEYSAENNAWDDPGDGLSCANSDLSCGDGSVGSPAAGWPCLGDLVAAGFGCFGHGRGMS